jgi:hypothetical protein
MAWHGMAWHGMAWRRMATHACMHACMHKGWIGEKGEADHAHAHAYVRSLARSVSRCIFVRCLRRTKILYGMCDGMNWTGICIGIYIGIGICIGIRVTTQAEVVEEAVAKGCKHVASEFNFKAAVLEAEKQVVV